MSIVLDPPSQLVFKRPLTEPIEEILYVKNVGNEPVAFKIKTTAPKQYCVRPNSAIIGSGSHVEVQIIFQPFREEPPPDFKCKDKFLVQTAAVKSEWLDWNMIDLWNHIELDYKDTISQNKIKCVFLPPELPQPYLNNESLEDNPPTPTLSHVPSIIETVKDEMTSRQSPPPSPTLVSTLPAIIDAARRASASHPPPKLTGTNLNTNIFNDNSNTSSISLLSHHTSRQTPAPLNTTTTTTTTTTTNNNSNDNSNTTTSITQVSPLEITIQEQQIKINELENDKKLLDQQIVDYKLKQDALQQQLSKKENEILTITTLKDQLKQNIQSLEEENRKQQQEINQLKKQSIDNSNNSSNSNSNSKSSTTVTAHAMQTSPLPIEGYPPQVLLSVSILVFILTYLFF